MRSSLSSNNDAALEEVARTPYLESCYEREPGMAALTASDEVDNY